LGDIAIIENGPTLIGDFSVPDVFAVDAITFSLVNGTVRITFGIARTETPVAGSATALVAIGRLVMPADPAQRLSLGLHGYLMKHGMNPSALVRGEGSTS
jgi:hypothetical protein